MVSVYNGEDVTTSPIFLDWYIEADNTKCDIDNRITILSFKDNFFWAYTFEAEIAGAAMNSNNQVFSRPLYLFANDQIGMISPEPSEGIRVFENSGEVAARLNFNYSIDGTTFDPDFLEKHYTGVRIENIPIEITYSEDFEEYMVFYVKNAYFSDFKKEQDPDNEYSMKVHVATFNESGQQIDDYSLDDFYHQAFGKGEYLPMLYIFSRKNNIVLLNNGYNTFTTVDLRNKTATTDLTEEDVAPLFNQSPNIIMPDSVRENYKIKQEPCPLLLNRLETGEITIASKENPEVVLETVPAGYNPAFYSFNSDGSCNIVFTIPDGSDE